MILRIKYLAILVVATISLLCLFNARVLAFDPLGDACNGSKVQGGNTNSSPVCESNNKASGADKNHNIVLRTIQSAANIIAYISGVIAVIIMIISGLSLIGSGGNSETVKNARRRIIYAAVGLAVIALAWTITRFIIDKLV
jgi:hypothetical protein